FVVWREGSVGWKSADLGEEDVVANLLAEGGAEVLVGGVLEFGVGGEEGEGVFAGLLEEFHFVGDVGELELGKAMLAGAEEFAGPAEGEVHLGDFEAVVGAGHGGEAFFGGFVAAVGDEDAEGGVLSASDAAAELVELGEAESLGVVDDDDGGVGDVDADLDN